MYYTKGKIMYYFYFRSDCYDCVTVSNLSVPYYAQTYCSHINNNNIWLF